MSRAPAVYPAPRAALFGRSRLTPTDSILFGATLCGGYAAVVCLLGLTPAFPHLELASTVFPLATVLISLLLAFRTNAAYDRWWEGRKLWAAMVNDTRNLAIFLDSSLPRQSAADRRFFADTIAAYATAVQQHLRLGVDRDSLGELDPETRARVAEVEHVPNILASEVSRRIYLLAKEGVFTGFELVNLKAQVAQLTEIVGGCERIKYTPIPGSYARYERALLTAFLAGLPLGLEPRLGFFAVPMTVLAFLALAGLEILAADIEDPFGRDHADLPTEALAGTIARDVRELLIRPRRAVGEEAGPDDPSAPPAGEVPAEADEGLVAGGAGADGRVAPEEERVLEDGREVADQAGP